MLPFWANNEQSGIISKLRTEGLVPLTITTQVLIDQAQQQTYSNETRNYYP